MTSRPPAASGAFYPSHPSRLRHELHRLLLTAPETLPTTPPLAYIVPHAAYPYSGHTAAYAYRILQHYTPTRLILIGPLHAPTTPKAPFLLPSASTFSTPLGTVPIDTPLRNTFLHNPAFHIDDSAHATEHSLEVQLPFLQTVLPQPFHILPLLTATQDTAHAHTLAQALLPLLHDHPDTVLVTTTDLSRFHPHETAERMDHHCLDLLRRFDLDGLARGFHEHRIEACGAVGLLATLLVGQSLGHNHPTILHHTLSSTVSGNRHRTVGYASAVL